MVASPACGCGTSPVLPKHIRRDQLDEIMTATTMKAPEVKALYARFRRLAPNGSLVPEQFKQTMGMIGLTDDPFLPDRMFQVFDKNKDGKLNFKEFATSLSVMIRGSEDDKLKLSFEMAAGCQRSISNEDFRSLIRACNTMMSSLVSQPRGLTSDEDIDRLFHELSSDDGEGFVITMDAYKQAAQSNEEFLTCLGLDCGPSRRATTSLEARRARSRHLDATSGMPSPTAGHAHVGSVNVAASQFEELRDFIIRMRQAVLGNQGQGDHLSSQTEPTTPGTARTVEFPVEDDPNERWWTPLKRRPKAVDLHLAPDVQASEDSQPSDLSAQFDKVLKWCEKAETAAKEGRHVLLDGKSFDAGGDSQISGGMRDRGSFDGLLRDRSYTEGLSRDRSADGASTRPSRGEMMNNGLSFESLGAHPSTRPSVNMGNNKPGIFRSNTGTRAANTMQSGRKKKRHRLLGPKKGLAVHFGHENWNMVISMMIGIRMSAGRSMHECAREVQPVDFIMKEKFSIIPRLSNIFDSQVSKRVTMTRFIDYAPLIFQRIRQSFGIQHEAYIRSVGPEQLLGNMVLGNLSSLSELSSEGKSGAFFYYTADGNYMMKTVAVKEHLLLKRMLKKYYDHIMSNPSTLIVRFLGLHCLRVRKFSAGRTRTQKLHFVVMGNMFNTPFEIHRRYDLKGSWIGRETPNTNYDPSVALKDRDFTNASEAIRVGPEAKSTLVAQLERDSAFLCEQNVIDYSLLLGIHDVSPRGAEGESEEVVMAQPGSFENPIGVQYRGRAMTGGSALALTSGSHLGLDSVPVHQRDCGGLLSSDKRSLYFMGVIDILTPYDASKRVEHRVKAFMYDWKGVSCCPPGYYAERFNAFMQAAFV